MKMTTFLAITIGLCVFILLYAVMTMANPDEPTLNWAVSTLFSFALEIALILSKEK